MRLVISALALAALAVTTATAQATPMHKHHYRNVAGVSGGPGFHGFHGGVLRGPLYNGQDYLGDDPDPNIRAYLLRDLGSRYGGGR